MSNIFRALCLSAIFAFTLDAQTVASNAVLSVSPNSITQGSVVTLTATITVNGVPATGGTVNFLDGARSLGTVQVIVSGARVGTAVFRTNSFASGNHTLTVSYSGAPNGTQQAAASVSTAAALTVQSGGAAAPVTTLVASQEASGEYNLTATVAAVGPPPTGTVNFINQTSGSSLGSVPLSSPISATFPQVFQSSYSTSENPTALIAGDFNQDGILDFAVADGNISVYLGDPSNPGHFLSPVNYVTGSSTAPLSIATADFNGDGVPDLAAANSDGSVSILVGSISSPGHFLPPALYSTGVSGGAGTGSLTLLVADFNLDGLPDLAIVGTTTAILLNNANLPGTFVVQATTYPTTASVGAVGDFNGDGYPDLAVNNPSGATIFFGDPAHPGQFVPASGASSCTFFCGAEPESMVVGDFNQDGVADVAITVTDISDYLQGDVVVFLGDPANRGNFLPPETYNLGSIAIGHGMGASTGLVTGDFNGDGIPDLVTLWAVATVDSSTEVTVLLGDPNNRGQFVLQRDLFSSSYLSITALAGGDFTGSGLSDLVFGINGNSGQPSVQVLLDSSSTTAALTSVPINGSGWQSIVASYSGDGNYKASVSSAQAIAGSVATTTTLTTSAFVIDAGDPITFTAGVNSGGSPVSSGTITFYDGSAVLASAAVSAQGTASYTSTNSLTIGSHVISAAYGLNGNYLPSTSATLAITVTQPGQTAASGGLLFVPITPCRVMDTRGNGFAGAFGAPSLGDAERDVPIPQSACGIPNTALAYSLNVTAVPQGPLYFLSVWPTGLVQPEVSTLNSWDGRVVANAAIVPAGANGSIAVYASNTTDAVIDINGYFTSQSTPGGLAFYPLTPCRVADTRGNGFTGLLGQPTMTGGSSRSFPIQQSACGIPLTAQAYALNMTAIPVAGGPFYYMTAWPSGQPQPYVSTLDSWTGDVVANAAIVPAGTEGSVDVFVTNNTDIVIDINGYFAPPGGAGALMFYPITPCRMADTRGSGFTGSFGAPSLAAGQSRDLPLASSACSIPSSTQAYSLNVTAVPSGPLGFLALWPTGQAQPPVSTLNSWRGEVIANAALVPAGTNGSVTVVASDPTDVVIDVNGVFAP